MIKILQKLRLVLNIDKRCLAERGKVIIKKDIFENLAERQEFEQKRANNDLLLIY